MRSTSSQQPERLTLGNFLDTAPGRLLLEWERKVFPDLTADAFGNAALQVGMPELDTLSGNRILSQWLLEAPSGLPSVPPRLGRIAGLPECLPVADESLDLVTMPHVLDFSPAPQQALREAVRVLEPEGRIVLTGFNPLGNWWLRQQAVLLGQAPYLPTGLVPVPLGRLKDWFSLLGLEIDRGLFGVYAPAFRKEKRLRAWSWIDKAGDRWTPHLSNLFALSAVKRVNRMRVVNCGSLPSFRKTAPTAGVPAATSSTNLRNPT